MKKTISALLCVAVLMGLCLTALAEGTQGIVTLPAPIPDRNKTAPSSAPKGITLPDAIASAFSDIDWKGWTPVAADRQTADGYPGTRGAIIMRRDGRNVLCMIEKLGSSWRIDQQSATMIYQGDILPDITLENSDVLQARMEIHYDKSPDGHEETYYWLTSSELPWHLSSIQRTDALPEGTPLNVHITYYKMYLMYSEQLQAERDSEFLPGYPTDRVYGVIDNRVGNFDIYTYPRRYADAAQTIVPPQSLSEGEQQDPLPSAIRTSLTGDAPVYGGLGDTFELVGTVLPAETEVGAIALEGAYVMIEYEEEGGMLRMGYVPMDTVDVPGGLPEVHFPRLTATVGDAWRKPMKIYDAPDNANANWTLNPGEEVIYLGTYGSDWTYIETTHHVKYRGFVRSEDIAVQYNLDIGEVLPSEPRGIIVRDARVLDDPYRTSDPQTLATVTVGDRVIFIDNLYGEYAYIEMRLQTGGTEEAIRGYIPRDAVKSMDADQLEGNG